MDRAVNGTSAALMHSCLEYGALAPSTHNTQPWRVALDDPAMTVSFDHHRALPVADPDGRYAYFSLGCFIESVVQAAAALGGRTDVAADAAGNAIRLVFSAGTHERIDDTVLSLLRQRRSNKGPYQATPLEPGVIEKLARIHHGMATVRLVSDTPAIGQVGQVARRTSPALAKDARFWRELRQWVRTNATRQADGMPGYVNGFSLPQSVLSTMLIGRLPKLAEMATRRETALIDAGPVLGTILTVGDTPEHWTDAGRAYLKLSLAVTGDGLACTPMTSVLRTAHDRQAIATIFGSDQDVQLFFRVGKPLRASKHTPRRKVADFVTA